MIVRALRAWWARLRLIGLLRLGNSNCYYASTLHFPECAPRGTAGRKCLEPYEALAEYWAAYGELQQWNYCEFLLGLSKARKIPLSSVLDLACGTGAQTALLAQSIAEVVGLDASEPMLIRARERSSALPSIRYVRHDFRNFKICQEFDAVVCASNSINYVRSLDELAQVFQCVSDHLRPNGLFVFDTFTQVGMQLISGQYYHAQTSERRFAIHFQYDSQTRIETSTVVMPSGSEIHTRIPIDSPDVRLACQGTGLVLDSDFSTYLMPGWMYTGPIRFFVLKKT